MQKVKSFIISRHLIMQAWLRVKANQGSAGIDGQTIEDFESNLKDNLYRIWNRMSSGSYMPQAVKLVEIPKGEGGGTRLLGIPSVSDRIAQMAVVLLLEPELEKIFHPDSYGYRPKRSAHDALGQARNKCWQYDWVLDMDIKSFFDTINHELLMRALDRHTTLGWVKLYIARWLKVPYETSQGERIERAKGVPQGSVIGPMLANLFLHYSLDEWMRINHPDVPFERYADDTICHCRSWQEADQLKSNIQNRLACCKLELNNTKTRIVYCKDDNRRGNHEHIQFDFLGYTFRPRSAKNRKGQYFCSFIPAISKKAKKRIGQIMRKWWTTSRTDKELSDLAHIHNPSIQGWIGYYGRFYPSALSGLFRRLNDRLVIWVTKKYKRFKGRRRKAKVWLSKLSNTSPHLFAHWKFGVLPTQPMLS